MTTTERDIADVVEETAERIERLGVAEPLTVVVAHGFAALVRALARIEQRIDGSQRIAELEATIAEFERAIAEALARSEGPL